MTINYEDVNAANEQLDQDFRLDDIDADDREEAEEAANRKEEYSRICLYLAGFVPFIEMSGIASRIMHHWSNQEDSFYRDEKGNESLFYRGFEITNRDTQWMMEWQDDQLFTFFDADLMMALKDIDVLIEKGGLK